MNYKIIAPIIIVTIIGIYLLAQITGLTYFILQSPTDSLFIFLIILLLLALLGSLIYVLIVRIKEIKEEDEDDLSKY